MNDFNGIGSFCGKRRQPFDDHSEMMCSPATDSLFTKSSPAFSAPNMPNGHGDHNAGSHAPKRICNGVSSVHHPQQLNTNPTMQSYQEVPSMGGDSRLYLDSPPHTTDPNRPMVTMETDDAMDMACDPVMGQAGYNNNNGAVYNMREMGQQLRGVTPGRLGYKASSQQRVCIRCLAGEAGHITHILDCVG